MSTPVPLAPLGEMRHPLAPHGWHMEPLVLIEDAADGLHLAARLPSAPPALAADADLDDPEHHDLADRLIAELTARQFPALPAVV